MAGKGSKTRPCANEAHRRAEHERIFGKRLSMVSEMENGVSNVGEMSKEAVRNLKATSKSRYIGICVGCKDYTDLSAGCLFDDNGDMLGACCKACHTKEYGDVKKRQ